MTTIAGAVTDPSRLQLDWARAEPEPGRYNEALFARYAGECDKARARGVRPVVVLHHLAVPRWLGPDFWLRLEAPARFGTWAATVADRLGPACGDVITLAEPNVVAWRAWVTGVLPPYRLGAAGDLVRALDHMTAAHVAAHAALHCRRPHAVVTLDVPALPVYELDGLLLDVLASRDHGVGRYDLHLWLVGRRRAWYANRAPATAVSAVVRRVARSAIPLEQALPRSVAAVYDGAYDRLVDTP